MINSTDLSGGAGRAAYRIHETLNEYGLQSFMLVQNKTSDDNNVIGPANLKERLCYRLIQRLNSLSFRQGTADYGLFNSAITGNNLEKKIRTINPDIIHLHWIANGFVNIRKLDRLKKPVIWTLHDMWPFTGGCHYDGGCERYFNKCDHCSMIRSGAFFDVSHINFSVKRKAYERLNLTVVTPSSWLAQCAKSSTLFAGKDIRVIHNGINLDVFKPIDKNAARKILNLDPKKKYILFGAINGDRDKRKGFNELCSALKLIPHENEINLLIFGASGRQNQSDYGFRVKYFGHLHDDISLSVLYAASDVMVVPSLQENLANTVVESLACGVPVVAFNIGGMPDMIEHKKNGYLADPFDTVDLAHGIQWVINNEKKEKLAHNARKAAEKKFNVTKIIRQYTDLYMEKLSS